MMLRWKMSLIGFFGMLLVGCGTSSSVKTVQRATIRLTIKWPKAKRAIDPTADTITLTVSSASKVVDTETITKPTDGSASQVSISVPLQKTRLDAVAFNSASPNAILDQGGAPSDPSSYLQLTPGSSNVVNIELGPANNSSLQFAYIDPVTGSVTVKNTVTALYNLGYIYGASYDQANHLFYVSGYNYDYKNDFKRLIAVDTLTGNTVRNVSLPGVGLLGYDAANQILFGLIQTDPSAASLQFAYIDPVTGSVTFKNTVTALYNPSYINAGGYTAGTAYDQANHLFYVSGYNYDYKNDFKRLIAVDTLTGNTVRNVSLPGVGLLGYDAANQILFGNFHY